MGDRGTGAATAEAAAFDSAGGLRRRSPMMITALAAVARAKKAAEALLARCSEKLFFFDGTFGKRKRREERKKREGACSTPKGGLPSLPPSFARLVPASLLHGCFCHCVGPNKSSIVQQKKQRPIHAAWNPARRRRRRIEARRLRLSLPRYSLSRRLFDSPEREENYGKNETEGKNDEGEGGRGESRTGKHRTR